MRKLLESTAEAAIQYLEKIDERKVAPVAEAVDNLDLFRESLPEITAAPETVLKILNELGSPATMAMAGPRFFGFVIGGALPVSLAANWLAAAYAFARRPVMWRSSGSAHPRFHPGAKRLTKASKRAC